MSTGRQGAVSLRDAITHYVQDHPGTNLRSLCDALPVNRGTATHHLRVLERSGHVTSVHCGRERLLFLRRVVVSRPTARSDGALGAPSRVLAGLLIERPGILQRRLAQIIGIREELLREHLEPLVAGGFVVEAPTAGGPRFYPVPRLREMVERAGGHLAGI